MISRFKISIPDAQIADLKRRLRATRWPDSVEGAGWEYGVEPSWLRSMVRYWAEDYDWRAQEEEMNRHEQYMATIDGVPMHFMRIRGTGKDHKALIFGHGWPWTFWDWKDVVVQLAAADSSFDLIVPSFPGWAFSSPLTTGGFNHRRLAELWVKLMDEIGYERFGAVGGDVGALVTCALARMVPSRLFGIYLTMPLFGRGGPIQPAPYAADEAWMEVHRQEIAHTTRSHMNTNTYDAQTLGYALNDSPVGLAAWLWQRRYSWSDLSGSPKKDPVDVYGRDFLCTTAALYWFTGTAASSMRHYHDSFFTRGELMASPPVPRSERYIQVPTGLCQTPKDIVMAPRARVAEEVNLQRYTVLPRGGHFAPSEVPKLIANEVWTFFEHL